MTDNRQRHGGVALAPSGPPIIRASCRGDRCRLGRPAEAGE
jgi:hypothetical protein